MATREVTVNDVLDEHEVWIWTGTRSGSGVLRRIYLNGYVPSLRVPGQVVSFFMVVPETIVKAWRTRPAER